MSIDSEATVWFLMRAAYGQEQKAKEFLEAKGIETFLPLQEHCFVRDGKRVKKMQSLIPNFLFVKSTENEMKKYIGKHPVDFLHHYYVPHKDTSGNAIGTKGIKPLVIPDEQMLLSSSGMLSVMIISSLLPMIRCISQRISK